ncbi:MAG: hypothetical protein WCO42_07695 [bacterium]
MKMKSLATVLLVMGMVLSLADFSQAQMAGLPVMDTAASREQGSLEVTPGIMIGNDMNYYGIRTTVTALDEMRVFLDLGQVDVNNADANLGLQGGVLYSLPANDVVDLGLRGTCYYVNTDLLNLYGSNFMLVFSDETLLENLYCYGGAGLDFSRKSTDVYGGKHNHHGEINPALSLGLSYKFSDTFSLFTEVDYVDGMYIGCGLSIR